jgi:mono/diheme cytochrome c family protein
MRRTPFLAGLAAAAGLALACGEREAAPAPSPAPASPPAAAAPAPAPTATPTVAAADEAKQIFATRCFTCHGMEGAGDGPGSAGLNPKPRDFRDPEWQASVTDEHIQNIVLYGGAAVGKSPTMPGNPDLTSKPDVVNALVAHVRGLARR